MSTNRKLKSLFSTRTMAGVYAMMIGQGILTFRETLEQPLMALFPDKAEKIDAAFVLITALITLFGGATTASGRVRAGGVYTPKGIPGPDPSPNVK